MRALSLTLLTLLSCWPSAARAQAPTAQPAQPAPLEVVIDARGIPSVPGNRSATILLLQDELEQTRAAHARIRLGSDQALTIVGGGLTILGGLLLMGSFLSSVACQDKEFENGVYNDRDCGPPIVPLALGAVSTAAGITLLAFSLPPLFKGLRERERLARYTRAIRAELALLGTPTASLRQRPGMRSVTLLRVHF